MCQQRVQIIELLTEQQVIHVADQRVLAEFRAVQGGTVLSQVAIRGVKLQAVIAQPGCDQALIGRPFDGDRQVGLMTAQVDDSRECQQV